MNSIKLINISDKQLSHSKYNIGYSSSTFVQKRVIDISLSSLIIVSTAPIMLYTIYKIRKESKGSIIFKQSRIGLNGKSFTCYKFRSMHTNSKFNPYTEDNDSRIFPFGKFMRKTRIDELPQLWNVIKGDMHIIGPRAEWDILVDKYKKVIPKYQYRHFVRPGITGLAQVSYHYGRDTNDAKQKLKYDLDYIENWSIGLELKVAWKTVATVFGQKGV